MKLHISEKDKFKIAFCITTFYDMLVVAYVGEIFVPNLLVIVITSVINILDLKYMYRINRGNRYMADSFVRNLIWLAPLDIFALFLCWI